MRLTILKSVTPRPRRLPQRQRRQRRLLPSVSGFPCATFWPISIRKRCRESWAPWVPFAIRGIQLHDTQSTHALSSRARWAQCCRTETYALSRAWCALASAGQRNSQQTQAAHNTGGRLGRLPLMRKPHMQDTKTWEVLAGPSFEVVGL